MDDLRWGVGAEMKKRFIRNIGGQIYDTEEDKFYHEDYRGKPLEYEDEGIRLLNKLSEENEQLKNKIDVLEDDNETYHKSLEQLNLYTKRFIPTKCINEFKDCKTNRYYWLDHEGNFEGCLELLNLLDCENERLKFENRELKR